MKKNLQIALGLIFVGFAGAVVFFLPVFYSENYSIYQKAILYGLLAAVFVIAGFLCLELLITLPLSKFRLFIKKIFTKRPEAEKKNIPQELRLLIEDFNAAASEAEKRAAVMAGGANHQTRDSFVFIASHQLRTPITGLRWALSDLTKNWRTNSPEQNDDLLAGSYDSVIRMSKLAEGLLETIKFDTEQDQKLGAINIADLIGEVIKSNRLNTFRRKITIKFEYDNDLPLIKGSRWLLELALQNILSNAIDYSFEGGEVKIETARQGEMVSIKFIDKGVGIIEEERDLVFERFGRGKQAVTINPNGVGLGLYLTRQIVENNGGQISFENPAGGGTIFTITLPIHPTGELEELIRY